MSGVKCEAAVHQRFRTCPVLDDGDFAALSEGYTLQCTAKVNVPIAQNPRSVARFSSRNRIAKQKCWWLPEGGENEWRGV